MAGNVAGRTVNAVVGALSNLAQDKFAQASNNLIPILKRGDFFYKSIIRRSENNPNTASTLINAQAIMKIYVEPNRSQLADMSNPLAGQEVPPLFFIITPGDMTIRYEKIVNRYKTKAGWIEEHWGDKMDKISCSGVTPAYYETPRGSSSGGLVTLQDAQENKDGGGLILPGGTGLRRKDSIVPEGYAFLMRLIEIYRNNGRVYETTKGTVFRTNNLVLEYLGDSYTGVFDSLTVKDDSVANPHNSVYSFEFQVTRSVRRRKFSIG